MQKLERITHSPEQLINNYAKQFTQDNIEQLAMSLVDFFKVFNDWHCGLN